MRIVLAVILLALPVLAPANPVVQAYPAVYELVRIKDGQRDVLDGGDLLLRDGYTERVRSGGDVAAMRPAGDAADQPRVALDITARRARDATGRLDLESRVEVVIPRGRHRSEIADSASSYIQGPQVTRVRFDSRTWQAVNDPTPIEVIHDEDGARYVLTILFQPSS